MTEKHSIQSQENDKLCRWRKRNGAAVWVSLLPVPVERQHLAGTRFGSASRLFIELLYPDEYVSQFLKPTYVPGGQALDISDTNKRNVVKAAATFPPSAFENFRPLFEMLDAVRDAEP